MHRTRFTLEVTTPVGPGADYLAAKELAERVEELLPPGSTVGASDPEELEEDTFMDFQVGE